MKDVSLATLALLAVSSAAIPAYAQLKSGVTQANSADATQDTRKYTTLVPSSPVWTTVTDPVMPSQQVETVRPGQQMSQNEPPREAPSEGKTAGGSMIVGIGGGVRIGIGEPDYGMVYGRLGYQVNRDWAVSLRPSYIFGNSDQNGIRNNQGAFQMPLTVDLFTRSWISPYLGVGIATNTDSNGKTEPMITGGVDMKLFNPVFISAGINYIIESGDTDSRDTEAFTVLYFKF